MATKGSMVDTEGASRYLGEVDKYDDNGEPCGKRRVLPTETLKQYRRRGIGPAYVKLPNGKVGYQIAVLDAFLAAHVVEPNAA